MFNIKQLNITYLNTLLLISLLNHDGGVGDDDDDDDDDVVGGGVSGCGCGVGDASDYVVDEGACSEGKYNDNKYDVCTITINILLMSLITTTTTTIIIILNLHS